MAQVYVEDAVGDVVPLGEPIAVQYGTVYPIGEVLALPKANEIDAGARLVA